MTNLREAGRLLVEREQAMAAEKAALRPDPGTDVRPPSPRRKRTVTAVTSGNVHVEVDGLPAFNTTGRNLDLGEVVFVEAWDSHLYVTGFTVIK